MANIAEGFERGGDKVFRNFLSIAKGSAAEVRSHLYVALDAGYIDQATFDRLYALAQDASHLIGGFMQVPGAATGVSPEGTLGSATDGPLRTEDWGLKCTKD